ncbi:unannotated protein [freshwater metagenome]|uniref:Unannotated protein n=1 Tax=freshwater metagenome TaxID=449393 RepID=A0A6J7QFS9_9ZZZZ
MPKRKITPDTWKQLEAEYESWDGTGTIENS